MKIKQIVSALLASVMLFAAVSVAMPVPAAAAYSSVSVSGSTLSQDAVKKLVGEALTYTFDSAAQMLEYEEQQGWLDSVTYGDYSLYVNRYMGTMYYVNNVTGQILTTNPYDIGNRSSSLDVKYEMLSQVQIMLKGLTEDGEYPYNSFRDSAQRAQLSVSAIQNGLRVNYTLGPTATRYLIPEMMTAERYQNALIYPLLDVLREMINENNPDLEEYPILALDYETYNPKGNNRPFNVNGVINPVAVRNFFVEIRSAVSKQNWANKRVLDEILNSAVQFAMKYTMHDPNDPDGRHEVMERYDFYEEKIPFVVLNPLDNTEKAKQSNFMKAYIPSYSFADKAADEKECGHVAVAAKNAILRCALEYTLNADGTLSVSLPANSITYDSVTYYLESITPLQFFGAGDMNRDGYVFFPDGSGTIVEFSDFYSGAGSSAVSVESPVYGKDFAYSVITGAHREQVSMPVYGLVSTETAGPVTQALTGSSTVQNGFFTVLEEGDALAKIRFQSGGARHEFMGVYASYQPYPTDIVDLSQKVQEGAQSQVSQYTIVSNVKYTGNYSQRIVMLTDPAVMALTQSQKNYAASYVGMATYYRDYLKETGVIAALETVTEALPLYIESFGSMEIQDRFLSFPITKSIPLTSFDDVITMYNQLSTAKDGYIAKAEEYLQMSADETAKAEAIVVKESIDQDRKDAAIAKAAEYKALSEKYAEMAKTTVNIPNVNFKLTGFANGGMYYTYPVRSRWERACGGAAGYKNLISVAAAESQKEGKTFGVYPDFDFQYIVNTEIFDGISNRGNVSRQVDNRYASKQIYNNITRKYESLYSMVVNPAALERLYDIFQKDFGKYEGKQISVSTIGSDLNSNFDKKETTDRAGAAANISALLSKITKEQGYSVMTEVGNMYAVKYATHILNANVDSSHFRFSSYTVPFTGMVLHGYVSYSGSAINYSGNPDYDILRAIENGAAPYYSLSYQNTLSLKEDPKLNKYYGVDYNTWYDSMVATYYQMNGAIGDLQNHEIVDHVVLFAERVISEAEAAKNLATMKAEIIELLIAQAEAAVAAEFDALAGNPANYGKGVTVAFDTDALFVQFADILNISKEELMASEFYTEYLDMVAYFDAEYPASATAVVVTVDALNYNSRYQFLTDSVSTDKENYVYTDYTNDDGNTVMVTYKKGDDTVRFLLNYNIYAVDVRLADGSVHRLESLGFVRL